MKTTFKTKGNNSEIKKIIKNKNFRNNQNYNFSKKIKLSAIKYLRKGKNQKFDKINYGYIPKFGLIIYKNDFKYKAIFLLTIFFLLTFVSYFFIVIIIFILLFIYSYYFSPSLWHKRYILFSDNHNIIYVRKWYYESKIKKGIDKIYYK